MLDFAGHFHVHDEYSPLDGAGTRNQLSYQAVRKGQTHLGITNHGRLGGVLEHVYACRHPEKLDPVNGDERTKDERLIPVLGLEAFWRPDRFNWEGKSSEAAHLCLHAASLRGWRTLMRLSSKSWIRREHGGGFYGKPVIDLAMLEDDNEDIIISSACILSPLSELILDGDESGARAWIYDMKDLVGDRLWLELMPHDLDKQRTINLGIANLSEDTSTPTMVTADVHVPFPEWKGTHSVLRMASYKTNFSAQEIKMERGEDVYTEEIDTVYMSSAKELADMFIKNHPDLPEYLVHEALDNTHEFARQVKWYVIGKTTKAPKVARDSVDKVEEWVEEGWQRLVETYPASHWERWPQQRYAEQRLFEMGVLKEKGVLDYFYITADIVRWAKSDLPLPERMPDGSLYFPPGQAKKPIRVGLGRGSAAGCLISYLLGITAIDPIPHKLLFERFMNPDREGYPDIDIDFESGGRDLVKEYLRIVYGHDHVADIIAYQTFAPRITIRDIGAVYEIDYGRLDTVTKSIGDTERGLEKIAEQNEDVAALKRDFPDAWVDMTRLENQILRDTRHAGGVVITPRPVNHYLPTQTGSDDETIVTAWADRVEFPIMSNYGFLKWDLLGVNSLNKQQVCVDLIEKYYGERVEPNELAALRNPYDTEQEVIDAFVKGLTVGIFQFSGSGITQLLRHIKPDNSIDIAVANALYRPGPIKVAFQYGDRKKDPSKVEYWHESLRPVLFETLGLIAFQEQVMEICKVLGKFTGGQADFMRKAVSKLYRLGKDEAQAEMAPFKVQWTKGCQENGLTTADSDMIWEYILEWGGYGFNRSHADSYGLQAYQDMWLKIHYPLAFYAALLTVEHKSKRDEQRDFLKSVLRESRYFEIRPVGPDVNYSEAGWTLDPDTDSLRYGLVSISGLGAANASQVVDNRPYKDYQDFIEKIPTGFGTDKMVTLAAAGAFDEIDDRQWLLSKTRQWPENVEKLKIKMSCGHLKSRTIKAKEEDDDLAAMVEDAIDEISCPHHPDATVAEVKPLDPFYELARFYKDHDNGDEPMVYKEPKDAELSNMELEALNVSLMQNEMAMRYKKQLDDRIFTEGEIEALSKHPKRSGQKHGNWCTCVRCKSSQCVVGGEVVSLKKIKTKKGDDMAFIDVVYEANQYRCTLFPKTYAQHEELLKLETMFLISGFKDNRDQIVVIEVADVFSVAEEQGWEKEVDLAHV
ncbi:MAG TPA: DNA polymerase III subunit alpha [Nitrospiraceae bacterium]|nr:DNA polymerase III subunit alpha [Nitrospiraceae bacterium]